MSDRYLTHTQHFTNMCVAMSLSETDVFRQRFVVRFALFLNESVFWRERIPVDGRVSEIQMSSSQPFALAQ